MQSNQRTYNTTTHSTLLAYQAAADLRAALVRAGFEPRRDFPTLRGDITASDEPFVTFGRISLPAVWQLTMLLLTQAESESESESGSEARRKEVAGQRMCAFHNSQVLSMRQRSVALKRHVAQG